MEKEIKYFFGTWTTVQHIFFYGDRMVTRCVETDQIQKHGARMKSSTGPGYWSLQQNRIGAAIY
jgi:hypothetical protein